MGRFASASQAALPRTALMLRQDVREGALLRYTLPTDLPQCVQTRIQFCNTHEGLFGQLDMALWTRNDFITYTTVYLFPRTIVHY